VYADGNVCISILHAPNAEDWQTGDTADERWKPVHTVESIVMSVISMLAGPNLDSPANVDAAVRFVYFRRCHDELTCAGLFRNKCERT
jgi:ubiquitin-conjugating enzyme E2 G1